MAIVASGSAPSYAIPAVVNMADLRLLAAGAFPVVMLQGTSAAGDGGGGFFYWSQSSVAADDASLVVAPSSGVTGRWLRLDTSAIGESFTQSGTGAIARTVQTKLREFGSIMDYGAVGDGSTDDTTALNNALTACKCVFLPNNTYKITANVVVPVGRSLKGESRYDSKILLSGNIEGITIQEHVELGNFRIIGNTSMTTDSDGRAKACLLLGTIAADAYRYRIYNLIVGGKTTDMDGSSVRCTGAGIKVGNTFLGSLEEIYSVNSAYGIDGRYVSGMAFNAMAVRGCEFQSNGIGAHIALSTATHYDTCTFENNDQNGCILDSCRGVRMSNPYFESNHTGSSATTKADLYVASNVPFGSANRGNGFVLDGGYFSAGTNSAYGVYMDAQRGIRIQYPFFTGYSGATNVIYVGDTNTSGRSEGFYSDSSTAPRYPSNFIQGDHEYTGVDVRGRTLQHSFSAQLSANALDVTGDATDYTIICNTEIFDQGSNYNNATGVFTAPITGRYIFTAQGYVLGLAAGNTIGHLRIVTTLRDYYLYDASIGASRDANNEIIVGGSAVVDMTAGNTASLHLTVSNGTKVVDVGAALTRFGAMLLC